PRTVLPPPLSRSPPSIVPPPLITTAPPVCVLPSMTTGAVIARGLASVMVGTPVPPIAKSMVSSPGFVVSSFAFVVASPSGPAVPSSGGFVTGNGAACAGEGRGGVGGNEKEETREPGRHRKPGDRAGDLSNVRALLAARKVDEGADRRCATARSGWQCTT